MTPITNNSAGLIGAIAAPRENFAARSAARQEALQLQSILTQQKELEVAQEQQAAAALEQQLAAERALPFFGKDLLNLRSHVKNDERQLFERLRDNYSGDMRKFWTSEGQSWMAGAKARLEQAPWYQQATQNRAAVLAAKQAMDRGERIVGTTTADGYKSGEQALQSFIGGRSDAFNFKGSYKPTDALAQFRQEYAPGRFEWERVEVSEADKMASLVNQFGQEVAEDIYHRQFRGVPIYYKTSSLNDKVKFAQDQQEFIWKGQGQQREQGRYNMAVQDQAMQRAMFGLQAEGQQLSNAKKRQELAGVEANGLPFDYDLLAHPNEVVALKHEPGTPKKLPYSGINVGGMTKLAGATLFGNSDEAVIRQLGLQKVKDGYSRGSIKEGFSPANGTGVFDLSKSQFSVVSVQPSIFYNPVDVGPNGLNRNGVNGYAKVTVSFNTPDEAAKAGLYNPNRLPFTSRTEETGIFDSETQPGVYDPATKQATLFVPMGAIDGNMNKFFMKNIQKSVMGQKPANEAGYDAPYLPSPMR